MNVRDLMTPDLQTCTVDDTADRAANLMWEHDIGFVPVVDSERGVLGVVTDRDLLMAAHLRGQRLAQIPLSTVMVPLVFGCAPDDTLAKAEEIMATHQVRRLPVIHAGRLVGVLSTNDLVRAAHANPRKYKASVLIPTLAAIAAPRKPAVATDRVGGAGAGLDALRQVRDELRLQIHLAKADALEEWEKAEAKWLRVQSQVALSEDSTAQAAAEAKAAWRQLVHEIGEGYSRVRASMQR